MKVCILSGSARKNNNTLRVSKALSKQFSESVIVDYQEYDLPNFNQGGVPKNNQTEFQAKLIDSIEKSDLLFVVTPEYNWFPTAEIINTIHQLAQNDYAHIFDQKVIATVGVSAGKGGRMPAVQLITVLNKIISYFNSNLDVIISDMAADTTGNKSLDSIRTNQLCAEVINFSKDILKPKGVLVCKLFMGEDFIEVKNLAKSLYKKVNFFKPESSRKESKETYLHCEVLKTL